MLLPASMRTTQPIQLASVTSGVMSLPMRVDCVLRKISVPMHCKFLSHCSVLFGMRSSWPTQLHLAQLCHQIIRILQELSLLDLLVQSATMTVHTSLIQTASQLALSGVLSEMWQNQRPVLMPQSVPMKMQQLPMILHSVTFGMSWRA